MKLLEVNEKSEALFLKKENGTFSKKPIKEITKNDIFDLFGLILDPANSIEKCDKDVNILNPADKIIYDDLAKKINDVIDSKEAIVKKIDDEYKVSMAKYVSSEDGKVEK
jgi:hypothetical protein